MSEAQKDADRIRREAVTPRKITFATPTEQQPLTTPKDNMKKVAELLKKKDEEIDINYVRTLVASAMKQQSKADTSRRLESNPDHCISTAQKDAYDKQHRDDESRTGSTERRRRTKEHPNPIPVPSESSPKDPAKGKGSMYAGKYKYRNPSPLPWIPRPPPPPRRRSPSGNIGPMVESISATTCRLRGTGTQSASLSLARVGTTTANLRPEGAGMKNTSPSHAEAGTTEATDTKRKVATEVGVSRGKSVRNLKAEAGNLTGPLADLPHHHPMEEVEAEAEAGGPALAQKPLAAARVTHGNVSTSTDPTTLAQSALAR